MTKSVDVRLLQRSNMPLQFLLAAMLVSSPCWGISNTRQQDVSPCRVSLDCMRFFSSVMKPEPLSNIDLLGVVLPSDDESDNVGNSEFDSSLDLPDVKTVLQSVEQLHNSLESSSDQHLPSQTFIKIIRIDANLNDQLPFSSWNLPSVDATEIPTATPTNSMNSSKHIKPKIPPHSKGVHYYKGSAYPPWSYGPPPRPAIRAPFPNMQVNPND